MNANINDYLIIENLVDYIQIIQLPYIIIIDNNTKYNSNPDNNYIKVYNTNVKDNKTYYFLLDSNDSPAFSHWIYESFIYIKLLIDLNQKIQNIKILTKNHKKYVKSFLNFFNITNEIVYKVDNYNNITYLPVILSITNKIINPENNIYFNYHLNYYLTYIKNNIINISSNNKCVFLSRNNIDNFAPNDRKITNIDKIKEIIVKNGGVVLDTYHLNNIKYQFSIVNNSDIIILDYGSSLFVNCLFLENKKIYIINNFDFYKSQTKEYPFMKYFIDKISIKNNISLINSDDLILIDNISI